jgi:hypothetical protein
MAASTMGTNKVFILDKYFNELQKFWDTEKRLQGDFTFRNVFVAVFAGKKPAILLLLLV